MTREEHLAWARARALRYVDLAERLYGTMFRTPTDEEDIRLELVNALSSFGADLMKHPAYRTSPSSHEALANGVLQVDRGPDAVRRWIEGFD